MSLESRKDFKHHLFRFSAARSVIVTDVDDMTEEMQKSATDLLHDVIDDHATESRSTELFKTMAKEINDRWKKKMATNADTNGDWRCIVGVPGLNGKAGFTGKKFNFRVEIEGFEIHMFLLKTPTSSSKRR